MEIISRKVARALGRKYYWTGKKCKRGHIDKRFVCSFACMTCCREKASEQFRSLDAVSRERKRDYERKRWQDKSFRASQLERSRRPDVADKRRVLSNQWKRENRASCTARENKRRAMQLRAMPAWADKDQITAMYEQAARVTAATGVRHDVDHIVPLQSPIVCGLHVACNLQILTHVENVRKSNRVAA